jgi:hypothetical protein
MPTVLEPQEPTCKCGLWSTRAVSLVSADGKWKLEKGGGFLTSEPQRLKPQLFVAVVTARLKKSCPPEDRKRGSSLSLPREAGFRTRSEVTTLESANESFAG